MSDEMFSNFGSDQSAVLDTSAVLTQEIIEEAAQRCLDNFGQYDPPYMVSPETYAHLELHHNPVFYDIVVEAYVTHRGRVSKRRFKNILKMRKKLFAKIMMEHLSNENAHTVGRQIYMAMGAKAACEELEKYQDSPAKEAALALVTSKDPIRFTTDHVPTGFKLYRGEDGTDT